MSELQGRKSLLRLNGYWYFAVFLVELFKPSRTYTHSNLLNGLRRYFCSGISLLHDALFDCTLLQKHDHLTNCCSLYFPFSSVL